MEEIELHPISTDRHHRMYSYWRAYANLTFYSISMAHNKLISGGLTQIETFDNCFLDSSQKTSETVP